VLDLDAYLERIGLGGRPSAAQVHRAHVSAIPFENLDPHRGVPISLAIEDLERKLVTDRRGGYCFEHNLLLKAALEALGASVELFLARVRYGAPPGVLRPRSHLVLRVVDQAGATWHADVGFGLGTPLEPLPFGAGSFDEQSGWRYRVVFADGSSDELVLQMVEAGDWVDLYAFDSRPVAPIDVEVQNWFTSTHPRSPFVTGVVASVVSADGSRTILSDWGGAPTLTSRTPEGSTVTGVGREEIPALLADRFGLKGFAVGDGGRIVSIAGARPGVEGA
jgi:N-hydroxyarylamine O-acetyltransferase